MRRIINRRIYDTETAERICRIVGSPLSTSDFRWHDTHLYKSPGGTFFIAGEGHAASMWGRVVDGRMRGPGAGIRLVSEVEAREYAEMANLDPEDYADVFGAVAVG